MSKDKRAAMLKKRRRAEQKKNDEYQAQQIMDELGRLSEYEAQRAVLHPDEAVRRSAAARCAGFEDLRRRGGSEVLKAYRSVDRKNTKDGATYASFSILFALHRLYGYGKRRLVRYCEAAKPLIDAVGVKQLRTVEQISDELERDFGVDFTCLAQKSPHHVFMAAPLALLLYPLTCPPYNFRRRRINNVMHCADEIVTTAEKTGDALGYMIEYLNKRGIRCERDGRIFYCE